MSNVPHPRQLLLRAAGLLGLLATSLALLQPAPAAGQSVEGKLVESGTEQPAVWAMVTLLDSDGNEVDQAMASAQGTFEVTAETAGTYRIRAERIGYRTWTSEPFSLGTKQTLTRRFELALDPVRIGDVEVAARTKCLADPASLATANRLWEEARKVLQVVNWAERQNPHRFTLREYRQVLHPEDLQPLRQAERRVHEGVAGRPYGSLRPDELAEKGYIQRRADTTVYYAPDARILLSRTFRKTHCFGLETKEAGNERWAGLTFRPVEGREVPDVSGTLWLDRETAELRRVDFDYWKLLDRVSTEGLGGQVHFQELPSDRWIVSRWRLRFPVVKQAKMAPRWMNLSSRSEQKVRTAIVEVGGEVTEVYSADGQRLRLGDEAVLAGRVVDTTTGRPLEGAVVSVFGENVSDITDSQGRFRILGVPPGEKEVLFKHPRIQLFRLFSDPVKVTVEPKQETTVQLSTPSPDEVLGERICSPGDAVVAGWVRRWDNGQPLGGVHVRTVGWRTVEASRDRRVQQLTRADARTPPNGIYRLCVPGGGPDDELPERIRVLAERSGFQPALVEPRARDRRFLHQDLSLRPGRAEEEVQLLAGAGPGADCSQGSAPVAGRVVDSASGVGLPGATVEARVGRADSGEAGAAGQTLETRTDGSGRFRFCDVPEGARVSLQARVGGRLATASPVELPERGRLEQTFRVVTQTIAQTGRIQGRVTEHGSDEAIEGATLRIAGVEPSAITDDRGGFRIDQVPPGQHRVVFHHPAYGDDTLSVQVDRGRSVDLRLQVPKEVIPVEPLEVEVAASEMRYRRLEDSGFYDRRGQGTGTFLSPVDVERIGTADATALVRTVPGVQLLARGIPLIRRTKCPPIVYVDGSRYRYLPPDLARKLRNPDMAGGPKFRRTDVSFGAPPGNEGRGEGDGLPGLSGVGEEQGGGDEENFAPDPTTRQKSTYTLDEISGLRHLSGENILAVEVYTGPASIPARFSEFETRCGLVLIWTKSGQEAAEEAEKTDEGQ